MDFQSKIDELRAKKAELLAKAEGLAGEGKLEELRVVSRAKCLLVEYLHIGEREAHRYIEKQAMDLRVTKKVIAEDILKTYDY